ncbi:putative signal-transduction protein [Caenispirillum salinarum AK4]|uniref:Putative signal-transduction protein n=1 Tax=Caenispirillum salinarum AK4 TaxID=1238182 RepID=K9H143_9PROT|nr:putative nucleotidyltransferase substrate binding domain-containing protein [Caenispirillum salinarum]EKV30759.1 putative signal-transduction protein [Caenispirillum salinarum AK4]
MPKMFDSSVPPFDRLRPREREAVVDALDIAYFRSGDVIIAADQKPDHLYVIIKGHAVERDPDEEIVNTFSAKDAFDTMALIKDEAPANRFEAAEEVIAYMLPRKVFLTLVADNADFERFYFQSLTERLEAQAQLASNRGMASFMIARVDEAYLHPPITAPAELTLREAARLMKQKRATSLLVTGFDGRLGVLSGTDIREAVLIDEQPLDMRIGDAATFDIHTIDAEDFLFNAQILMTRHGVKRLPVMKDGRVHGVLELIDLLSFMSSHSHLVTTQVDRAQTIEDLRRAADGMVPLVTALHGSGVKIRHVTELVTALNRKIFAKLFEFLAPPEIRDHACLIVMGSEGRGEQILRTDQDNALILRDGHGIRPELIAGFCGNFNRALLAFDYPPCKGNMMVTNPEWVRTVSEYGDALHRWINVPSEFGHLNLAAFTDSAYVAGDPALLAQIRDSLFRRLTDNQAFFSFFARPVTMFDTPIGLFHQLRTDRHAQAGELDIKKGGIFPIVHGIRAMALEKHVQDTNTFQRIEELARIGELEREFAQNLSDAFAFLLDLRLKGRLERQATGSEDGDNFIQTRTLHKLQRDVLKDSLLIVKEFKAKVSHRYKLAAFS